MSTDSIVILEDGRELSFSFGEMLSYHGGRRRSDGFVTDEFIELTRRPQLGPDDERRVAAMKSEMPAG